MVRRWHLTDRALQVAQGHPLYLLRHAWAPFATDGIGPENSLLFGAHSANSSYRPYIGVSRTTKESGATLHRQ